MAPSELSRGLRGFKFYNEGGLGACLTQNRVLLYINNVGAEDVKRCLCNVTLEAGTRSHSSVVRGNIYASDVALTSLRWHKRERWNTRTAAATETCSSPMDICHISLKYSMPLSLNESIRPFKPAMSEVSITF